MFHPVVSGINQRISINVNCLILCHEPAMSDPRLPDSDVGGGGLPRGGIMMGHSGPRLPSEDYQHRIMSPSLLT